MGSFFDFINIPLGYVIRFCYEITNNYAIALLLFALIMQIILSPFGVKQQKNMVKQAKLRPREMAIRKKYAGRDDKATQQKLNEEIMQLYRDENFNPASGCLPLLIQFPILIALYNVVIAPLRYICGLSNDVILKIKETITTISPDYVIDIRNEQISMVNYIREHGVDAFKGIEGFNLSVSDLPDFTILGGSIDLSQIPTIDSILVLIPIVTLVCLIVTQKITRKLTYMNTQQQNMQNNISMKIMDYSLPLLSTYISFQVAGAIGVYWIFRNLLMVVQTIILHKIYPYPVYTEEELKAAEKEYSMKSKGKSQQNRSVHKGQIKSLHYIDDDVVYGEAEDDDASSKENEKNAKLAPAPLKKDERKTQDSDKTESDSEAENDTDGDSENAENTSDNAEKDIALENTENAGDNKKDVKKPNPNAPKKNYPKSKSK